MDALIDLVRALALPSSLVLSTWLATRTRRATSYLDTPHTLD